MKAIDWDGFERAFEKHNNELQRLERSFQEGLQNLENERVAGEISVKRSRLTEDSLAFYKLHLSAQLAVIKHRLEKLRRARDKSRKRVEAMTRFASKRHAHCT